MEGRSSTNLKKKGEPYQMVTHILIEKGENYMSSEKTPNIGLHKWKTTDYMQVGEVNDNFGKLDAKMAEVTAQLTTTTNQIGVSVEEFGAIGNGIDDDTQAFINAINYCNINQINLEISGKSYLIKGELPFPSKIIVRGKGHSTNLILNLPAGQTAFKAKSWVYSFGFEGLRFSIASGGSKDVGAIRTDYCLRGAFIKNIWSFELYTPFYFGEQVWGLIAINNVFGYLHENINTQNKVAFYGSGNTIMVNNLELVGGWKTALKFEGVFASKIHKFNIAGSNSTIQLREAIILNGCSTVSVQDGWIEQLDDFNWANGKGKAIYAKDSDSIEINNVLVNAGGIYSDKSKVKATNIKFSQSNGGFRTINNGNIQTDLRDIRYCDFQDGDIFINGLSSNSIGLIPNPILKKGIPESVNTFLVPTNATISKLDFSCPDFISGDASVKSTIIANNHGIKLKSVKVVPNELYTVNVKVKKGIDIKLIKIASDTETSRTTTLPSIDQRTTNDVGFYTLSLICSSSTSELSVRIIGELNEGARSGEIILDSIDVFRGYSSFDPSKHVPNLTFQYKNTIKPKETGAIWQVGEKVYNPIPVANGFEGWVCTTSDGTGKSIWKGFGAIEP